MGEVVNMFARRAQPEQQVATQAPAETGPAIEANAGILALNRGMDGLRELEEQGAAAKVLAALLFYAHQGQDQGLRARRAVIAMQELLNGPSGPDAA